MNTAAETFDEIYKRLTLDMPLFIKSGFESFISLFLFTLILFFLFLLLQTSKNLVFKKGKNLPSLGICLVGTAFVLYAAFLPKPTLAHAEPKNEPTQIKLQHYENNKLTAERYLYITERERLIDALSESVSVRDIVPTKALPENGQLIILSSDDGLMGEIMLDGKNIYLRNSPDTGKLMRVVLGKELIYNYVSELKI